jgi:putative membrane protein
MKFFPFLTVLINRKLIINFTTMNQISNLTNNYLADYMHGGMMDGGNYSMFGMGFGLIGMIFQLLIWVFIIVGAVYLVKHLTKETGGKNQKEDSPTSGNSSSEALKILKNKFAKGEISEKEYKAKKKVIKED